MLQVRYTISLLFSNTHYTNYMDQSSKQSNSKISILKKSIFHPKSNKRSIKQSVNNKHISIQFFFFSIFFFSVSNIFLFDLPEIVRFDFHSVFKNLVNMVWACWLMSHTSKNSIISQKFIFFIFDFFFQSIIYMK